MNQEEEVEDEDINKPEPKIMKTLYAMLAQRENSGGEPQAIHKLSNPRPICRRVSRLEELRSKL